MVTRFLVMVAIWTAVFLLAFPHQEVSVSPTEGSESGRMNGAPPLFLEAGGAPCPEAWVYYRHACYHFSKERRSWQRSRAACLSLNSSLLRVYSREQQDFLRLLKSYHWLGLVRSPANGSWQWEDGSELQAQQLTLLAMQNGTCCVYGSSFKAYAEDCLSLNAYICMRRAGGGPR